MLVSLQVKNLALIENASIEFGEGLNILSGETGAGKSIIVQALELLLGARADPDLVRRGEDEAEVTGLFSGADGEWTLRRVISVLGKSRAYHEERLISAAALQEMARRSVDLAGQHENQVLLRPERHLALLDAFAGTEERVGIFRGMLAAYRELLQARELLVNREREARSREDFLRYQMQELESAALQEGEEERLKTERDVLKHAVRLGEVCARGMEALDGDESSAGDLLAKVLRDLQQASSIDPEFLEIAAGVETAERHVREGARLLERRASRLSADPERLCEVEDRLALISRLRKKYGLDASETDVSRVLLQKKDEIASDLKLLDSFGAEIAEREEALKNSGKALLAEAAQLTAVRQKAAVKLSREVEKEVADLGMPKARFQVGFAAVEPALMIDGVPLGSEGTEKAEFLLAPNPGEGFRTLAKTASGGELSRIFLALKTVLGTGREVQTCIFDEVDAGIGGGMAEIVGKKLSLLSRRKQVIAVTHLPQIASFADHHFVICKITEKGRTQTSVRSLKPEEREEEIARMLAGVRVTDTARAHARAMIQSVGQK